MKKFSVVIIALLLFFLSFQSHLSAKEEVKMKFFGVGAVVNEIKIGEYLVKTKGEKAEEGFVYTPMRKFSGKEIKYVIALKGKGTVRMKAEETDARGQYVKGRDLVIELTEEWKMYELPFNLEEITSQLDVFVLTSNKDKIEFYFRDLKIKER